MLKTWSIALLMLLSACATPAKKPVTPDELVTSAKSRITEVSREDVAKRLGQAPIIIDVREPYEFKKGHLPGAVNIPRGRLEWDVVDHPQLAALTKDNDQAAKNAELILYCGSGGRSALAADTLQKLGYKNVLSMAGGFRGWKNANRKITR